MKEKRKELLCALAVFLAVYAGHSQSPHITSTDSQWSIHTAVSIIREGNIDLDEFAERRHDGRFPSHGTMRHQGKLYPSYPVGPSLMAVPVVLIFMLFPRRCVPELGMSVFSTPGRMEMYTAAAIVALASVVVYKTARHMTGRRPVSFAAAMVFAYCTSAWSTASRALWQHGPMMLLLAAALLVFVKSRKNSKLSQLAALPLFFSYWVRPTALIPIAVFSVFMFIHYREYFPRYLLWGGIVAGAFLYFNYAVFGGPLPPYHAFGRGITPGWKQSLAANWFSPNRGLLIFSPVLLFSLRGMFSGFRGKSPDRLNAYVFSAIILHWLGISFYAPRNWWAGHSYGPRLFSDVMPFFVFFLVIAGEDILRSPRSFRKRAQTAAFIVLAGFSFFVHFRGAYMGETWFWNVYPVNVDRMPSRVWDWKDLQFLR